MLWHTVVVSASAADPAPMQFSRHLLRAIAVRDTGRPALIIYYDLSTGSCHREVSLLLRCPPGREAYPGDVFYPQYVY
jgi:F0F1-type ATP synthase alpha subunit